MTNNVTMVKLDIEGEYNNFTDFYGVNKVIIYNNIINLFEDFKDKKKKKLVLELSANIENIQWKTELEFTRKEIYVLKRDILPFFEEIEDYETCEKVFNLCETIK
jgi:hypothetical protein